MLEVSGLRKSYHKVEAVKDISFKVSPGEIAIILGPNGAGKSTLIKCVAGLLRYKGDILIDSLENKTLEAKRILSYIPETPSLYDLLSVSEHVDFVAKAYYIKDYERREKLIKQDGGKNGHKNFIYSKQKAILLLCYRNFNNNTD